MNKKKFVNVSLNIGGTYTQPIDQLQVIIDEISEGHVGESWYIKIIEMTQDEYDKLPEFLGH